MAATRERWGHLRRHLWQPPRPHGEQLPHDRVVGPLELFYDLAVVVLVAQAARHLAGHLTWGGLGEFAAVFTLVWIAWANGSLHHELHGHEDARARSTFLLQILLLVVMAAMIPQAGGARGAGFAVLRHAFRSYPKGWTLNAKRAQAGEMGVRFAYEDLLRTKLAPQPAPLLDTWLALAAVKSPTSNVLFARRKHRLRSRLPRAATPLFDLMGPTGDTPTFLVPAAGNLPEALDTVPSTPRDVVRTQLEGTYASTRQVPSWVRDLARGDRDARVTLTEALHGTYQRLLAPEQQVLHSSFHQDQAWRAHTLATGGIHALLSTIPGNRWTGQTLENDDCTIPEISLDGRGVTLMPSATWTGGALLDTLPDGSWLLIYAVMDIPTDTGPHAGDPLAALLGRTRADILRLTAHPHNTTAIAAILGISPASASEHTNVLRKAGLVTTQRTGRSVLHTRTLLGDQLAKPSSI